MGNEGGDEGGVECRVREGMAPVHMHILLMRK